jgi:hypothetical protein
MVKDLMQLGVRTIHIGAEPMIFGYTTTLHQE